MNWRLLGLSTLLIGVLASALGVVQSKHESRKRFVELQRLYAQRDELNIEWGRLQLEQSTWATHGRIEQVAREQLRMAMPAQRKTVVVMP